MVAGLGVLLVPHKHLQALARRDRDRDVPDTWIRYVQFAY